MSIKFPIDPTILWDRTPIGGNNGNINRFIISSHTDICNFLILLSHDLEKILETIINEEGGVFNLPAQLRHYAELTNDQKQVIDFSAYSSVCRYPFYLSFSTPQETPPTAVTIPLRCINSLENLPTFPSAEESELLQSQLGKAIKFSRNFALKNFVRLRATGKASKYVNTAESSTISYSGSLKLESTLPMFTIQCTPIQAIPFFPTPLSTLLLSGRKDDRHLPSFGYLTLNQIRKLVFLQENDASISVVPTIGVWLRLGISDATVFPELINELIYHPLSWAACLRFIQHDKLLRHHILNHNTFLLVILCHDHLQYFEITPLVSNNTGSYIPVTTIENFPLTFANLDYTVNLNYEKSTHTDSSYFEVNDLMNSVLCKFKMHSSPRSVNFSTPTYSAKSPVIHSPKDPNDYFLLREVLEGRNEVKEIMKREEVESVDTIATPPAPRELKQLPIPVNSPMKPATAPDMQNSREFMPVSSNIASGNTNQLEPPLVQIIMSQSEEITKLRKYIHTLRKIVSDLGGEYPDLYVEEVKDDSLSEQKQQQVTAITKEPSINILDMIDNNNLQVSEDHLESTRQEVAIEDDLTLRYLSEEELVDIRNFAELSLPFEMLENQSVKSTLSMIEEDSELLAPSESSLKGFTLSVASPSETIASNNPSDQSKNATKFQSTRNSQPVKHTYNKHFIELPTQIYETESMIKIESHYV